MFDDESKDKKELSDNDIQNIEFYTRELLDILHHDNQFIRGLKDKGKIEDYLFQHYQEKLTEQRTFLRLILKTLGKM